MAKPSLANLFATTRPIPPDAPVTMALFVSIVFIIQKMHRADYSKSALFEYFLCRDFPEVIHSRFQPFLPLSKFSTGKLFRETLLHLLASPPRISLHSLQYR